MKEINKQILRYFINHQMRYKWLTLSLVLSIIIGAILTFVLPTYFYKIIFDLVASTSQEQAKSVIEEIIFYLFIAIGVGVLGNVFWRGMEYINNYLQPSIMRDIENDAFRHLQKHSFTFFTNSFGGALVTKVNRLTRSYERLADRTFFDILFIITRFVASIVIIFFLSKILALILIVWFAIYIVITLYLYIWKYKYDVEAAKLDTSVTAALADSITNVVNTKVFAKSGFEIRRFFNVSFQRYKARKKSWDVAVHINIIQAVLMIIAEFVLMYVSLNLWAQGKVSLGFIILLQLYYFGIAHSLWNLGRTTRDIYESFADSEEMIRIMNLEIDIKDPINPEPLKIKKGEIKLEDVDFVYEGKTNIFSNFKLDIKAGETIGLVGESGSGKTTITKLLLRFVDVNSGSIKIDGQDIRNITQDNLRSQISYVSQEPILFHRTLEENIAYSNPGCTKKEIIDATKKANIHDFIETLPLGYQTLVGERGIKLSGGERQRVAIARAILKKAPIIVLDEATSALDSNSERLIQKAIENLMKGKTTIVIAHRLSTIKMMDRIIVLDKGKIVEEGSHNNLLKKKGKYAKLWEHQTGSFL